MQVRCPTCGKPFDSEQSPAMPFCCQRCKLIDLGRWFGEKNSIPIQRQGSDDESELPEGWHDAEEN